MVIVKMGVNLVGMVVMIIAVVLMFCPMNVCTGALHG